MDPLAYLHDLESRPIRLGLAPLRQLLIRMKHPERRYVSLIIGGTNGKGSIAAMIAAILNAGGFRVGLYTSPHLMDVRERIRVNGQMIPRQDFSEGIQVVRQQLQDDLTYFELLTAVALYYFCQERVNVAVLEVGMGGRLDATNVTEPAVSVISNIAVDHRRYLGSRIEQIAREKAGIIKNNGCCLTAARQKSILGIFQALCLERKARLIRIGDDVIIRRRAGGFSFRGLGKHYDHLSCSLRGRHQITNAALAVAAVVLLGEKGFSVDKGAVDRGLRDVRWEGRLETLQEHPTVLLDGAHNPAGITTLCSALKEYFFFRKLTVIFGALDDKDYRTMLKKLAPLTDLLILTRADSSRSLPPETILPVARQYHRNVIMIEKPEAALNAALNAADPDDLICVTGSLYLICAAKGFFEGVY
jgi:dihydrofolate synthase / folylpolyglutamate synthase